MARLRRIALVLVLALASALMAFAAGAAFAAAFLVAPGSGLAGPAEVIGYGLLAALVAAVVTLAVAPRLSTRRLGLVTLAGSAIAILLSAGLVVRYLDTEAGRAGAEPQSLPSPWAPVAAGAEPGCGGAATDHAHGEDPACRE